VNQSIESRKDQFFTVALTGRDGKPLAAEARSTLQFEGTNVWLYSRQNNEWVSHLDVPLELNDTLSSSVIVRARSWTPTDGVLKVKLTNQSFPAFSQEVGIHIKPPWFVPLMLAIAGGLCFTCWQLLRRILNTRRKPSVRTRLQAVAKALLLGVAGGGLAYLLADFNILGIRGDTTGLRGFFLLGLLFSYVGADFILSVATKGRKDS
jgi:hypothetical protein